VGRVTVIGSSALDGMLGLFDAMRRRWVIGDPETAHARIEALASRFEIDEVMIHPVASAPADSAPDRSLAREQTLRLLVEQRRPQASFLWPERTIVDHLRVTYVRK
jgi:alkanesulfonate monooxygenase SsuD/methylene tetrahydromethanopterin reductase-like flavin-dependent oxidoreductase (luciferase family)